MVVRRTIEALRERPKEDKTTVAAAISGAVMIIIFLIWTTLFFRGLVAVQNEAPVRAGEVGAGSAQDVQTAMHNFQDQMQAASTVMPSPADVQSASQQGGVSVQ